MSARIWPDRLWRAVLLMAAGALLAGMSARTALARQPVAGNTAAAAPVAAASSENKGGGEFDVAISSAFSRSTKQDKAGHAPKLKIAPAKERPIVPGRSNVVHRNAIGIPVARPNGGQKPTGPNLGRAATLAPPVAPVPPAPSGAALGLGGRALPAPHMPMPAARPLVLSRGAINGGASFTRPGTALAPLGGPAKRAATGINGTSIQPKH